MTLDRAEVWTKWPAGGGTLKCLVTLLDPVLTTRVGGECRFSAKVVRGHASGDADAQALAEAYAELRPGRVLRLIYSTGLWTDVVILTVGDGTGDGGVASITCGGLSAALAKTPPVTLTTGSRVSYAFDGIGLTPSGHLTTHVKPQWDAAGLTFLEIGEVLASPSIDVSYGPEGTGNAWAAIGRIAETAGLEPSFRWDLENGVAYLDLIPTDGSVRIEGGHVVDANGNAVLSSGLPQTVATFGQQVTTQGPRLEVGHNAAVTRQRSVVEQRNRIHGVGADGVGIGDAIWVVSAIDGTEIALADLAGGAGPLLVDDQLNGLWLEASDRVTRVQISDSSATDQSVTVSSASAFSVGDRVRVRADSNGTHVTALSDPSAVTDGVILSGIESRPDIPETVNLMLNADQSVWTGDGSSAADAWAAVGSPTLTRTTDAAHRQIGPYSCKVETNADGEGYASPLVDVLLTADHPYVSGCLSFKLTSGAVRVELVATDGVDSWIFPDGTSQKATTTATGVWVLVGVAGIDLLASGVTGVRMRLVQDGPTAAVFYVDAGQVTESPGQLPLIIGAGPTQLWQVVNTALALSGLPRVRYEGQVLDFHRLDPATYPYERLIVGALHTVMDHDIGIVEGVRLLELSEHLDRPAQSSVVLSSLPDDLRSLRERVARPRRNAAVSGAQLVARSIAARVFHDGVTTASDATLTSASAEFTDDDVSDTLWLLGAGADGAILKTTVASKTSATEIEMAATAAATLTNVTGIIGTAEGVLSLAAGLGSGGGGALDPDDLTDALLAAQVRELARQIAELAATSGTGTPGEPGEQGPPGNGYEPIEISLSEYAEPGTVWPMELEAPAIGVLLGVTSVPPAQIDILGVAGASTPELSIAETLGTAIIPGAIIVNRDATMIDKWYLNVTPTSGAWEGAASTGFNVAIDPGPWGTAPLTDSPFENPGPLGEVAWYSAADEDYFFSSFRVGLFEAGVGVGGDSSYPMIVDGPIPSAASEIGVWTELYVTIDGTAPHSASVILSANGNGHLRQIEARFVQQWDGDATHTLTLELAYTNNSGTRTVLDTDTTTAININGTESFGLLLKLTRNAQDEYDMTAELARLSEVSYPGSGDAVKMTIGTPDLTVSVAEQAVDNADHRWAGFRLIDCDSIDTELAPYISPSQFGLYFTTAAESGDYDLTARVMPIWYALPPVEEEG